MAIGVDYSDWLIQGDEMKRRLVYQDTKTGQYIATIYLDCKVERGVLETHTFLSFMFTPFRVVDGLDLGLSLAPLDGGPPAPVGVLVTSVENGEGALMSPRTPQGLRLLLSHLLTGQQLKFGIWQGPEQLVDMPFYNDAEFARLHRNAVSQPTSREPKEIRTLRSLPGGNARVNNMMHTIALINEPLHSDLWQKAEEAMEDYGPKRITEEYERLLLERLFPPRRSLWSRLFGR